MRDCTAGGEGGVNNEKWRKKNKIWESIKKIFPVS